MNKKILLGIAAIAIGLVVLPQTIALFSGQHDWYDTFGGSEVLPCIKCHADTYQEISQGGAGTTNDAHRTLGAVGSSGCEECHATAVIQGEGAVRFAGGQFHAAAAPLCVDCHNSSGDPTGNGALGATEVISGSLEVHKPFVNASDQKNFLRGANEACVACHTHIGVNITWQRATTLVFNATEVIDIAGNHTWDIANMNVTGVNITKTVGDPSGTGVVVP